jgi:hypothetical protein
VKGYDQEEGYEGRRRIRRDRKDTKGQEGYEGTGRIRRDRKDTKEIVDESSL